MSRPVRSWLYVPAHQPERVAKAMVSGADAVVLDLEDAVPVERKAQARAQALATLRDLPSPRPQVWVRINPPATADGQADLAALVAAPPDGVRVPRVDSPETVARTGDVLECPMQLILESARGLLAARELAVAHPRVAGIGLGEADLAADLGVAPVGLDWARGWVVAVARAAGLPAPVQSVYTLVSDTEGLRRTTADGRERGFFGRSVVHPRQIAPVHEVYRPGPDTVAEALDVVEALRAAQARGESATLTADGRFVDPAVVAQAQLVLELADLAEGNHTTEARPSQHEERR